MPRLPPKPEVPPIVAQSLVAAALSVTACARTPPRIGQPPPVRIGAERPPEDYGAVCELQVIDERGQPIAGARVDYANGHTLQTDAEGWLVGPPGTVRISHPNHAALSVNLCADSQIALDPLSPPRIGAMPDPNDPREGLEVPHVRIGMHPGDLEGLEDIDDRP